MPDELNVASTQRSLDARISELSSQIEAITRTLSDRGGNLMDEVGARGRQAVDEAEHATHKSVARLQHEASAVAEVAREAPIVTATGVATIAVFGLVIGYLLGTSSTDHHRRYW